MKKVFVLFTVLVGLSVLSACGKSEQDKKAESERDSRISNLEKSRSMNAHRMSTVLAQKGSQSNPMSELGHYLAYEKENGKARATQIDRIDVAFQPSEAHGLRIEAAPWKRTAPEGTPVPELTYHPNRWMLYVGLKKKVSIEFYANKNRKGEIFVPVNSYKDSDPFGVRFFYNQKTGIVIVDAFSTAAADGKPYYIGQELKEDGTLLWKDSAYFDIIVHDDPIRGQLPETPEEVE